MRENKDGYYGQDLENPTTAFVETDPGSMTWGDGHMVGFDFQSSIIFTPTDTLNISASYLETAWDDVFFDYQYEWEATYDSGPPGLIVPVTLTPMVDGDYSGKPMTHAPKYTINAVYKHIFNLMNGGALEAQVNVNYKSAYQLTWSDDDYPYNYQEAYTNIDLTGTYINPDIG